MKTNYTLWRLLVLICLFTTSCDFTKPSVKKETIPLDSTSNAIGFTKDSLVYDNDTIAIYKIDSTAFFSVINEAEVQTDTLNYISDFEVAKKLLKGRVLFGGYNDKTRLIDSTFDGELIYAVHFDNGKSIITNEEQYFWDAGFVRYYPTEDIVLCEGGHSSDFSIDLANAVVGPDLVGNPEYILLSPSGKYRLNGWFPGQECSDYFLQKKTTQGYQLMARIPMHISKEGFDFCTLKDEFWKDDTSLYFRNVYFGIDDDPRLGYFRLQIK